MRENKWLSWKDLQRQTKTSHIVDIMIKWQCISTMWWMKIAEMSIFLPIVCISNSEYCCSSCHVIPQSCLNWFFFTTLLSQKLYLSQNILHWNWAFPCYCIHSVADQSTVWKSIWFRYLSKYNIFLSLIIQFCIQIVNCYHHIYGCSITHCNFHCKSTKNSSCFDGMYYK